LCGCHNQPVSWHTGSCANNNPVPRYYFHFSDGNRRFSDTEGHELAGIAAAREFARNQVRELATAMCHPQIQDLSRWTLTAVNGHGRTICEMSFDLRPARAKESL